MTIAWKSIPDNSNSFPETTLFWFGKQILVPQRALFGSWWKLERMIEWMRNLSYGGPEMLHMSVLESIEDACKIAAILDNNHALSEQFRSSSYWTAEDLKPPLSCAGTSLPWVLRRVYGTEVAEDMFQILLFAVNNCECFEDVWGEVEVHVGICFPICEDWEE